MPVRRGDSVGMKIIKRSGSEVIFDMEKIEAAIRKANNSVVDSEKMNSVGNGKYALSMR